MDNQREGTASLGIYGSGATLFYNYQANMRETAKQKEETR